MKNEEIKIEALKLMFATQGDEIAAADLEELSHGERYGSYLQAMDGSIRRCHADLLAREIIDDWPTEDVTAGAVVGYQLEDRIAVWVPYWIAGELYREDEPELAAEMMARYERQIGKLTKAVQKETIYSLTEV